MSPQPAHAIFVSRSGMAMCPACMTHFKLTQAALTTTECPFCETTLGVSTRAPRAQHGLTALRRLNQGKSGLMLAALGVSLTLAACEQKSPEVMNPEPISPVVDTSTEQGGAAPPTSQPATTPTDMGSAEQDASADMQVQVKPATETISLPKYGLPPSMLDDDKPRPKP
jgi:hypothetical protein